LHRLNKFESILVIILFLEKVKIQKQPRTRLINSRQELGTKRFTLSVVSGSSLVVTHMMTTGGLHGR
jgi:hypothetical protein